MAENQVIFPNYCIFLEYQNRILVLNPNTLVAAEINKPARLMLEALCKPVSIGTFLRQWGESHVEWNEEKSIRIRGLLNHWLHEGIIEIYNENHKLIWQHNPTEAPPFELYISLTNVCNLRCIYCYNYEFRSRQLPNNILPLSLQEWMDVVSEAMQIGIKRVVFTGGEPLLSPILRSLIEHCKKIGLEVHLFSNGTLIDKEWARWIADNVDLINISLDSAIQEQNDAVRGKGSFDKICKGIQNLKCAGTRSVFVRPVVTIYNVCDLPKLVDYCYDILKCDLGPATLYIPSSLEEAKNSGLLPDFETYLEKTYQLLDRCIDVFGKNPWADFGLEYSCRCGIGSSTLSIDPIGDVYPCQALHDIRIIAGNIRKSRFKEIYMKSSMLSFLRNLQLDKIPVCSDCPLVTICGGGCRAIAWNLYGSFDAYNELFCPLFKRGIIEKIWHLIDFKIYSECQRKSNSERPLNVVV